MIMLSDVNQLLLEVEGVALSIKKHKEESIQDGYYKEGHLYDALKYLWRVEKGLEMLKKEVIEG